MPSFRAPLEPRDLSITPDAKTPLETRDLSITPDAKTLDTPEVCVYRGDWALYRYTRGR